jgi:hypothetical protein
VERYVMANAVTAGSIHASWGWRFWGSKTLLSAIELGLFSLLADGPRDGESLRTTLGLHPRSARTFSMRSSRSACSRGQGRQIRQHARGHQVPRPQPAHLHRRHPRDGQRAAVSILGSR